MSTKPSGSGNLPQKKRKRIKLTCMVCGRTFDDDYRKQHERKYHDGTIVNARVFGAPANPFDAAKKRKITINILIVSFVVFFACFSRISAYIHDNDVVESYLPEVEMRALPALRWDGVCPKKAAKCPASFEGAPPLIMLSLDGFHPDYLNRGVTPTLKNLANCGTHARFMYSVFPTKTFPNHFSQVTGLNPPSHGIIDNSMYDPFTHQLFKVGKQEALDPFWWEKEPLWVTAKKQGKITASYFWPGSDIPINGTLPNFYMKYKSKTTFEDRVDQVLAWLDLPVASRPNFITLYANQPDNAAHWYGVKSQETTAALAKVDRMVERLYSGLQQRNLVNCVNVIILSDHGMSDIDCKRSVDIQNYINVSNTYVTMGPFGRIRPKGKWNPALVNDMVSKLKCQSPHMRAYRKEQLPVRMHYADHHRIEAIFLDMDAGWTVVSESVKQGDEICTGGAHGYDNMFPDMRAIFIAQGPSIKRNYTIRPFISTEMYEMLAELIKVKPNPNNGTRGSMHHLMTSPHTLQAQVEPDPPAVGTVPSDDMEYKFRLHASNCSCPQTQKQTQEQNVAAIRDRHLPFGVPYSREDNNTLRLLYNKDYIAAFDLKYRIPMWSSFTLKGEINITKMEDICWKGDARIPISDAAKCDDYTASIVKKRKLQQRPLYSPDFSTLNKNQANFITNSIPKSLNYTNILEKPLNQILARWTSQSGELNVVTGPAFDLLATGIRPPIGRLMRLHEQNGPLIVPTHIFVIATWCNVKGSSLKSCPSSKLDAHAFLLPNQPYTNNCEPAAKVIANNVARVVDVENLTGISFFTGLPIYDAISLRTIMPERLL